GHGYWLVTSDGGVLAYGDAGYFGAAAGKTDAHPAVALTASPTGLGYRVVSEDGQAFGFGDAAGTTSVHTNLPIVGAATLPASLTGGDSGTRFTNTFATTPICAPMRTSIMSGRYQHNTGIMNNQTGPNLDFQATLQKYLHDGGYQTGLDGKFLINWHYGTTPLGFDHYAGVAGGYTDTHWTVDGHSVSAGSQYVTDFQADR